MRVLVVVDMQNDFVDGALGTPEAVGIIPNICKKIKGFDGKVVFTMDTHQQEYLDTQEGKCLPVKHCINGTSGWELQRDVRDAIHAHKSTYFPATPFEFDKPTFGSVELGLHIAEVEQKKEIEEIVLVGLCTDICVISNALLLKAFVPEIPITVDASCCAGVTPESHRNALVAMRMCQINIINE